MEQIVHPIPPLYNASSRILMLGTMPSPKSREAGFFYAHPQNRFWRVLAAVLDEPFPETVEERAALALRRGIALWDVLHSCEITGAADASIRDPQPNDLSPILQGAGIRAVFATGKKSEQLYKKYIFPATKRPVIGLPSTSPANCACSFEALCEAYRKILPYIKE